MDPFTAAISVPPGQPDAAAFLLTLRITNQSDVKVAILNPDMGIPDPVLRWPFSKETYQTAVLISFHFLSMSVTDETGHDLRQQGIDAWSTPILQPKLDLSPGGSFELSIPLGDFYRLASGRSYRVAIEYGDKDLKVSAQALVTVP